MLRYVILGSGAAGISAAEAIRDCDPTAAIRIIGREGRAFYSRPGLAYYLSGEIPESLLYPFGSADFDRLGAEFVPAQVTRLVPDAHELVLAGGPRIPYDRLLLATGSAAVPLKAPGAELAGVMKLDNLQDAQGILRLCRGTRAAVVVGGGITALELVEGLRARGVRVHYFMRQERYWSNVLNESKSKIIEDRLAEEGVVIHRRTELAEILGRGGPGRDARVSAVRTRDGREIECSLVACAIGVSPQIGLAREAGLAVKRGILVDENMRTSAAGVYAAGDVVEMLDPLTGRTTLDTLWSIACAQGRAAGRNMAGESVAYTRGVPLNVTRLAGLTTTIIGMVGTGAAGPGASGPGPGGGASDAEPVEIVRGESERWRHVPDALPDTLEVHDDSTVTHLRLMIGPKQLAGAVVIGDQRLSRPLQHLIAEGADITPIRDALLSPGRPLGQILLDFWSEWRGQDAIERA